MNQGGYNQDYNRSSYRQDAFGQRGNDWNSNSRRNEGRFGQSGNYGYDSNSEDYGRNRNYRGNDEDYHQTSNRDNREDDRGWWDRTKDEVSSWFGDDDARHRRDRDNQAKE